MKKIVIVLFLLSTIVGYSAETSSYFNEQLNKINSLQQKQKYNKAIKLISSIKKKKNKLDEKELQQLTNKLNEIQKQREELNFKKQFVKEYDPYNKTTIYKIKKLIPYTFESKIVSDENNNIAIYLLVEVRYVGKDWIYPHTISFLYDNEQNFKIESEISNRKVNCSGSTCIFYENFVIQLNETQIKYLTKTINSQYEKVKVFGKNNNIMLDFYPLAKKDIDNMIKLYYFLKTGGNL